MAAGPEQAQAFAQGCCGIGEVFNGMTHGDGIETGGRQPGIDQVAGMGVDAIPYPYPARSLLIEIYSGYLPAFPLHAPQIAAPAAANVQQAAGRQLVQHDLLAVVEK